MGTFYVGAGAVICAAVLGLFARVPGAALGSTFLVLVAATAALWASYSSVRSVGWVAWAIGPLGVVAASLGAYQAVANADGSWLTLQGSALAAAAVLLRAWFDAQATLPVRNAAAQLVHSLPTRAHVPVKGDADALSMALEWTEAVKLRTGEEVIVLQGEVVPVDGVVRAGEARILPYPGAETPASRSAGAPVLAGATVVEGALRIRATRVGDNRALVRLTRFGREHGADAAPVARVAEAAASWGGLAAIGMALCVTLIAEGGGLSTPLSAAGAVLLAAPLLALRRAVESPLQAAAAAAGARGIVFRSAAVLDLVGRTSIVAMSPMRILTEGRLEVVEMLPVGEGPIEPLVALAAAAERAAPGRHPIALAIERYAREQHVRPVEARRASYLPGRGVTATAPSGEHVVVGSRRLLLSEGISVAAADAEASRAESAGRTPLFVSQGGRVRAIITLQDTLRAGARPAVQRLFDLNLEVVLLTGDQRGSIQNLARALDVAHVKAELLPEERGQEVRSLRGAGGKVAVVGFPGEDDPALSSADVGIVLGAAGGVAGETEVALVSEDVRDAAAALWIARATRDAMLRATRLAAAGFGLVVATALAGLIVPGVAALLAIGVDAYGVRVGARLLRRIALRLPTQS